MPINWIDVSFMKYKIISINLGNFSSTGKIMYGISEHAMMNGYECWCAYPERYENVERKPFDILFNDAISYKVSRKLSYLSGRSGCFNYLATKKLLRKIKCIKPNIIHLHNIHGDYINLSMLFSFLRKTDIKIVWTLHDCWAFTGHCPYFDMTDCQKWKTKCYRCPSYKMYPSSFIDNSKRMWSKKKELFCGLNNLLLVTPSLWLSGLVKQSFLSEYDVRVINNGIDLNVFRPFGHHKPDFIDLDKKRVLGVAFGWDKRKGLDVFINVSNLLPTNYQIILVGLNKNIKQQLPPNITIVPSTSNQNELAAIYSYSNLLVNPTREDNFPTVNIESLACGTPVLTFNTGGSPEIIDSTCGSCVERDDINSLVREVIRICETNPYTKEACLNRAALFNSKNKYQEYVDLYESLLKQNG